MKDVVTLIFGDSIAYGLYDKELGWSYRLKKELTNNHFIFNLAIPGSSSNDILNKFEIELKNRYNDIDNFKLIFSFGIKDTLNNNINEFKDNLLKIINISKKYTKDITFIGLIKPDIEKRTEYNLDIVILFNDVIEKLCNEEKIKFIKIIDLITKEQLVDGLHPNNTGHKIIKDEVLKVIYD